jgi:O-succinylbenzoate synthase
LSFRITLVRLPLLVPFTASHGTESVRNALVLQFESDGVKAFSECATGKNPHYSYEDNETALHIIRDQLSNVLKERPTPEGFLERADTIRGHNMAKAAVEMLLWDYHAKLKNEPLSRALGEPKGYSDVGISLGIDKPKLTTKRIGEALEKGYRRVKVKIDRGREYEILKSVRDTFPEIPLSADANSCYTLKDLRALKRIDRFNLIYLEQPLKQDAILDHVKLAKELITPICLDESISTVEDARRALDLGAAQVINIKPGRVGGLGNSLRVARMTRKRKGHIWVGGMLETGVGRAFNIALASQKLIDYPGDTSPNERYFARDIVRNPFTMKDGRIRPNRGPGIGVELDDPFLAQVTEESWKIF